MVLQGKHPKTSKQTAQFQKSQYPVLVTVSRVQHAPKFPAQKQEQEELKLAPALRDVLIAQCRGWARCGYLPTCHWRSC